MTGNRRSLQGSETTEAISSFKIILLRTLWVLAMTDKKGSFEQYPFILSKTFSGLATLNIDNFFCII